MIRLISDQKSYKQQAFIRIIDQFIIIRLKKLPSFQTQMDKIRQIINHNQRRKESNRNLANRDKIHSFIIQKSNNTVIRPYCLYPIISHTYNQSISLHQFSNDLRFSKAVDRTKKIDICLLKPKTYHRLSLHRSKIKQLSSYGYRTFSMERPEWQIRQKYLPTATKQSNTCIRQIIAQNQPDKYLQENNQTDKNDNKIGKQYKSPKRISNRRIIHLQRSPKEYQYYSENIIEPFDINAWETNQEFNEE